MASSLTGQFQLQQHGTNAATAWWQGTKIPKLPNLLLLRTAAKKLTDGTAVNKLTPDEQGAVTNALQMHFGDRYTTASLKPAALAEKINHIITLTTAPLGTEKKSPAQVKPGHILDKPDTRFMTPAEIASLMRPTDSVRA